MDFSSFTIFPSLFLLLYVVSVLLNFILSFVVLFQDKKSATNVIFFFLSLLMSLWLTAIFLQGISELQSNILLAHRIGIFIAAPLSASFFLFAHTFPYKKILLKKFSFISVLVLTAVMMVLNISPYAFTGLKNGTTDPTIGLGIIPFSIISTLFSAGAVIILIHKFFKLKGFEKKQLQFVIVGILILIVLIIATLLIPILIFNSLAFVSLTPLYSLIFLLFTAYAITKYELFNVKVLITQALTFIISIVLFAKIFSAETAEGKIIDGLVFLVFSGFAVLLILNVKKEVTQRKEIEKLAVKLEKANKKLKMLDQMKSEFVSIASHQLRSPLTSIRGYTSMLLEGSFGKLTPKARDAIERISESGRFMASSVEDYLNVSRIQAGNMKYEYSDFNIKDLVERIADDSRVIALKKGLLLTFKSDLTKKGIVHADIGKTRQVIDNLINNSLKYTPKGSISIFVYDKPRKKKIYIDITDTGIGMSPKTAEDMFEKFERASNANAVNVTGTGLGLYIARKMAREMNGEVTASSGGEGKGSTFTIELPLHM